MVIQHVHTMICSFTLYFDDSIIKKHDIYFILYACYIKKKGYCIFHETILS